MKLGFVCGLVCLGCAIAFAQQPDASIASLPARHSPQWLTEGVVYEIFPRAFSPEGTFQGITARLDQLQKLGVTILWLMPIHPTGEVKKKGPDGSPYSVRDYYAINPKYGTAGDLRQLVQGAHRRGMKVLIDIVANHTSWDSVMMRQPEFYKHDARGQIVSPYDWTDVAALNYANPKLRRYMTDMLVHWIKDFDLDGFRCDAAAEVPTDYWESARSELERAKPDIAMLAEASKPDLLRSAFDIDYSWPLMHTLNKVLAEGGPATAVQTTWEEEARTFPKGALHMRISDDHDELRAVERYGAQGALAASALMFTLDGVPLLYNGMEIGDTTESGAPALFETLKIVWPMAAARPQFGAYYSALLPLRRQHPVLEHGELQWLRNSDEARAVTFLRHSAQEDVLVLVNLSNRPVNGTVEDVTGAWAEIPLPAHRASAAAAPAMDLAAYECRVFVKARQ